MKKFFATLLAIIVIAALGLFFGWAQLGVPPDSYGLIQSKSHGLDARLVKAGEFRWVWYKLIPTNVKTIVFRLSPVSHEFSAMNTLPSGRDYALFAGIDGGFSWEIRAAFSFSLRPEALPALVAINNIGSQEDLDYYEKTLASQIEAYLLRRINSADFSAQIEDALKNGDSPELARDVQEQFPFITYFSLTIKSARFPDFNLYRQAQGLYEAYVSFQKDYLSGDLQEKARGRVDAFRRFGELEQYGELLTRYPVLLDYLALESSMEK